MAEAHASFVYWMHETAGYTYHGDAPLTGLTNLEYDTLLLGHLVQQEQKNQKAESAKRGRKYTEPAQTTTEAMNTFQERANG